MSENKGMPILFLKATNSCQKLWYRIGVLLFLFVLSQILATEASFAHDFPATQQDRTKFTAPFGKVLYTDCDLPDAVKEQQSKKVLVLIRLKGTNGDSTTVVIFGTGIVAAPGVIVTSRHLLLNGIEELKKKGQYDYMLDDGLPKGINFDYEIQGFVINEENTYKFPLTLKAMEEPSSLRDIMALEMDSRTKITARTREVFDEQTGRQVPNPYRNLLRPVIFTDNISIADPTYTSGFLGDGYYDLIDFTLCGQLSASVENMPANKDGIKRAYRIYGKIEHGFSGGPSYNKEGEVFGLNTRLVGYNFFHVLSSKDVLEFLKEHKIK